MSKGKKLTIIATITAIVVLLALGTWYLLRRDKVLRGSATDYQSVTVQTNPNTFYDVWVPSDAILIQSNLDNTYEFDKLTISKLNTRPIGSDITIEVDGCYIAVDSKDKWLLATQEGMKTNASYTTLVDWDNRIFVEGKPSIVPIAGKYHKDENGACLPEKQIKLTTLETKATLWYPERGGFLYATTKYAEYRDTLEEYAAKMESLYKVTFDEYYHEEGIFYARKDDFYVGVRNINLNTQFAISGQGDEAFPYFLKSLYG